MEHKGLRYNEGKLRYDLIQPDALEGMVSVLTKGAEKYSHRNWESGMGWYTVIASLKRHLKEFELGHDIDDDSGLLHVDHMACNAHFLAAYARIYPQGDDRQHKYLKMPKIGLDIDDVLSDFVNHFMKRFNINKPPVFWNDPNFTRNFDKIHDDKDFWMSLPVKSKPEEMKFEPHCYITSRSIPEEWTIEWLFNNGFPDVKLYCVGREESKEDAFKSCGADIFIDDRFENFVTANKSGLLCYLMDMPHNRKYNVGFKRITNINEVLNN